MTLADSFFLWARKLLTASRERAAANTCPRCPLRAWRAFLLRRTVEIIWYNPSQGIYNDAHENRTCVGRAHTVGKVILICGKMGSGKTTYANELAEKINAVIVSHDEIMLGLFGGELYEKNKEQFYKYHSWVDAYTKRIAGQVAKAGAIVIFANGFWARAERDELRKFYSGMGVACELHYVDTPEEQRRRNIQKRKDDIRRGELGYILTDEKDINHFFEPPDDNEMDFRVREGCCM